MRQSRGVQDIQITYIKKGMLFAVLSAILWGLDGVFLGAIFLIYPFVAVSPYVTSIAQSVAHSGCACLWSLIRNFWRGKAREYIRTLATKPGLMICLGAICGGPLAMTGYILGINFAGPAYAMPISALSPCVSSVLAAVFLRERLQLRTWLGIIICVFGAAVLSYTPPAGGSDGNFYLGIMFSTLSTLGWGIESVISKYGMDLVDSYIAVGIKYISSLICNLVVVFPLFGVYDFFFSLITCGKVMIPLAITSFVGFMSIVLWYKSLNMCGVGVAMTLNSTYVLWGVVFSYLFSFLGIAEFALTVQLLLGVAIIILGIFLVSCNPQEAFKYRRS